ncbi:MAG: hypothetical protein HZB45_01305 [Mycolicibacterium rufum]|nr:hypothetical protein [Mycolicibacterium rufum]
MAGSPPIDLEQGGGQLIATCTGVGVYGHALTFGNHYVVLSQDTGKQQIRVLGDHGKKRWFPTYYFDLSGRPVVKLVSQRIDDPLGDPLLSVDVVLEFSDGQWRWCTFVTPEILSGVGGHAECPDGRLLMYDAPHMIVVSAITRDTIENSIAYIESQGRLLECSVRCGEQEE